MTQNVPGMGLTEAQRRLAEVLANPDIQGSISEQCREAGVPRRNYYRWIKNEEFIKYVNYLVEKYTDSRMCRVWNAVLRKAEDGDIQAAKLLFELKQQYSQKLDIHVNSNIDGKLSLESVSDEELDILLSNPDNLD